MMNTSARLRLAVMVLVAGVVACQDDGARDRGRDALDSAAAFARDSAGALNRGDVAEPAGPGALIDSTADAPAQTPGPPSSAPAGAPVPAPQDERAPEPTPSTTSDWTSGIAERKSSAGVATLVAVRSGRQEGFDRMVFEFGAGAPPGYHVSYIDRPVRACGSGQVVPLPGDGWLEIRMLPARAHTEAGQPTVTERTRVLTLPNLKQVSLTCDFEADVTWVAGVLSPNNFRVLTLQNPTRLVVDIRHR